MDMPAGRCAYSLTGSSNWRSSMRSHTARSAGHFKKRPEAMVGRVVVYATQVLLQLRGGNGGYTRTLPKRSRSVAPFGLCRRVACTILRRSSPSACAAPGIGRQARLSARDPSMEPFPPTKHAGSPDTLTFTSLRRMPAGLMWLSPRSQYSSASV